jgi:hypothetical protein
MKAILLLVFTCCAAVAQENIETLSQLDDYRRQVNGDYLKALRPVYVKGVEATPDEKTQFIAAALNLKKLQKYMCPTYGKRLAINNERANPVLNNKELERLYRIMKNAKISTSLPATRAELNEAQQFLDAFAKAMQLPVIFTN